MQIYHYDDQGIFKGESTAELDPLEGKPLIPGHSTTLPAPSAPAGSVALFGGNEWSVVQDTRGEWFMPDGQRIQLNLLAEPVPVGATRSKPPLSLDQVKVLQRADIRKAFEAASNANVTVDGVVYQGGYEKAMRLDAAKRLAELAGQTATTFYDLANVGRMLTIAQATSVVLAISVAFQTEFARKQERMVAIDGAATVADVDLIVY